jgi:hypothetical protein
MVVLGKIIENILLYIRFFFEKFGVYKDIKVSQKERSHDWLVFQQHQDSGDSRTAVVLDSDV